MKLSAGFLSCSVLLFGLGSALESLNAVIKIASVEATDVALGPVSEVEMLMERIAVFPKPGCGDDPLNARVYMPITGNTTAGMCHHLGRSTDAVLCYTRVGVELKRCAGPYKAASAKILSGSPNCRFFPSIDCSGGDDAGLLSESDDDGEGCLAPAAKAPFRSFRCDVSDSEEEDDD